MDTKEYKATRKLTSYTTNWVDQKKLFWLFEWIYIGQQTERRKSILIKEIPLRFVVGSTSLYMSILTSLSIMTDDIEESCSIFFVDGYVR